MATVDPTYSFFDGIGLDYEKAYGHDPSLLNCIEHVHALLPPNSKVLDVGCGTGKPVSATLAANGHQVRGIDASKLMVQLSREQVPRGTFEQANMLQWQPANPDFDCVFAIFSFFALSRQQHEAIIEKFSAWVKPGGLVVLGMVTAEDYPPTEPGHYDADGLCANGVPNHFMGETFLVCLFTKEGLRRLVRRNGFEIVEEMQDAFEPPAEAACDGPEQHYYLVARRRAE